MSENNLNQNHEGPKALYERPAIVEIAIRNVLGASIEPPQDQARMFESGYLQGPAEVEVVPIIESMPQREHSIAADSRPVTPEIREFSPQPAMPVGGTTPVQSSVLHKFGNSTEMADDARERLNALY